MSGFSGGSNLPIGVVLRQPIDEGSSLCCFFSGYSLGPCAFPLNPVLVKALQGQIEELKRLADKNAVNTAVIALTRSVSGPAGIFDPYAVLPAWEHAASVASEKKVPGSQKLNVVFRQYRSLVGRPDLQEILVRLVAERGRQTLSR